MIGMGNIKQRRLELEVSCHPTTNVGDYVPFYFCPRSIMLYVIYQRNHPQLEYRGGQEEIIHFEADLTSVVQWADENQRRWAFTLSNAAANYAQFFSEWSQLDEIDWEAVASTDFRDVDIKEAKQAEFLVYQSFPWQLVERIGVHSKAIAPKALTAMREAAYKSKLGIAKRWYD